MVGLEVDTTGLERIVGAQKTKDDENLTGDDVGKHGEVVSVLVGFKDLVEQYNRVLTLIFCLMMIDD